MKKGSMILFLMAIEVGFIFSLGAFSQNNEISIDDIKKEAPKIFIDCDSCDLDFIKNEITFVNYVRDRQEADIYVIITELPTGSKGTEYTISFLGQNKFEGNEKSLKYYTKKTDTDAMVQRGITNTLKIGIIPFLADSPLIKYLSVTFQKEAKPSLAKDKWNFWVFSLGSDCSFSGEESRNDISVLGSISANRLTQSWKINLSAYISLDKDNFIIDDKKISSSETLKGINCLIVKSINDHFSVGGYLWDYSSTYSNIKNNFTLAPAIEYDVFPYSQATRRQIQFLYQIGVSSNSYYEETIFDKKHENLFYESLSTTVGVKEPWGTITGILFASNYFVEGKKYRLAISGDISLRIIEGLSLELTGGYSGIHDQLSLSKAGATIEEILLRQKELTTNYNYYFTVGLSYTFGAIYSNIINPRFGSTQGIQIHR